MKNLLQPMIYTTVDMHPVAKLFELCQKNALTFKIVDLWEKTCEYEIHLENEDECIGSGHYKSKNLIALNRAALDAYNNISERFSSPPPMADDA